MSRAPTTARAAYLDSNQAVSAETQRNGGGCYPIAKHPQLTDHSC